MEEYRKRAKSCALEKNRRMPNGAAHACNCKLQSATKLVNTIVLNSIVLLEHQITLLPRYEQWKIPSSPTQCRLFCTSRSQELRHNIVCEGRGEGGAKEQAMKAKRDHSDEIWG